MVSFNLSAARCLCVVMLLSLTTGAIGSQISVKQYPESVQSVPGGSVALVCEFNHGENEPRTAHVSWYRGESNGSLGKKEKLSQSSNVHFYGDASKGYSILVLKELRSHDGVVYVCEVLAIFPPPVLTLGTGTLLEIHDKSEDVVAVVSGHHNHTDRLPAAECFLDWRHVAVISAVSGCCSAVLMASVVLLVKSCRRSRGERGSPSYEVAPQEYEDMTAVRRRMLGLAPQPSRDGMLKM